ncbi:MAG: CD1871A family CXXC motif-containing protein [Dissulfurimicrobium sp.]
MLFNYTPLISLIGSLGLIVFGLWSGEAHALWQKAVTVCLSCIGIG